MTTMVLSRAASDDHACVQRIIQRDLQGLSQLYNCHSASVYSLAYRILRDEAGAATITEAIFLSAWNTPESLNTPSVSIIDWLLTRTRETCIAQVRERRLQNVPANTQIVGMPELSDTVS